MADAARKPHRRQLLFIQLRLVKPEPIRLRHRFGFTRSASSLPFIPSSAPCSGNSGTSAPLAQATVVDRQVKPAAMRVFSMVRLRSRLIAALPRWTLAAASFVQIDPESGVFWSATGSPIGIPARYSPPARRRRRARVETKLE